MPDKQRTRSAMREARRSLTAAAQRVACEALACQLSHQPLFREARHVAFYLPNDGEIDPRRLIELAVAADKTVYLPVLDGIEAPAMHFAPWRPGEPLQENRFGIPEPQHPAAVCAPLEILDVVCLPLVAFDRSGNRLGMGGGFYDRTFAALKTGARQKPLLVGLAHHFQQLDNLPTDPWDVPLHAVATDRDVIFMSPTPS